MNLAGYIRVSTEGQVDAYGKPVQKQAITTWAGLNGHTIVEWVEEDGVSGKTDSGDRPALSALVARADEFDGIVAFDASRIARRLYVQETLLAIVWASGLRVFTTTAGEIEEDDDDPTRILIRQVLGCVAEFEHRSTVKRLHAARRVKASGGGFVGGTAKFGTRVVGSGKNSAFAPDEAEREAIAKIRRWHRLGFSQRDIAARLTEEGVPTKTGRGTWHHTHIARILNRPEN